VKAEGPAKPNSLALGGLPPYVPAEFRNLGSAAFALLTGILIWHMPAPSTLGETGLHFLATLSVAIILWILETLDDYVVALLLLLSWLALAKLPTEIALSGFASSEWFFALAAIGIAASITKVGLLRRLALVMLKHVPASYTVYIYILSFSGLLVTPFLPNVKGRMALAAPVTQAVSTALNFKPRSNPSAGLALSTYVGFPRCRSCS
jgi:di/tricarboxylate transporter